MTSRDLRIRLLGELEVQRRDGSVVASEAWRTGKTSDLLRILALNNGHPVRATSVVERLWPSVSLDRARASLRTACSQIRRAVGENCLIRQDGGVLLQGAWVDAVLFRSDARLVHAGALSSRHDQVLNLAQAAERLYRGDFHAADDDSPWAITERAHLAETRRAMLCHASESANATGRYAEAVEFASEAVRIDRTSEAAHRALMHAHAGQGEVASALRAFETVRTLLADELGADPSPQTRALHLRLLRGDGPELGLTPRLST